MKIKTETLHELAKREKKYKEMEHKYINNYAQYCPYCRSSNIIAENEIIEDIVSWRTVTCIDCKKSWAEQFELTGVSFE
jgi:aerobic-type carbon monoxide dehydrogenase small subunit (CoxS/CutS family)